MGKSPSTIGVADLVGNKVVTAEGETIGHVVDLRLSHGKDYRVVGLVLGGRGWLERIHVIHHLGAALRTIIQERPPRTIPWDAVDRYDSLTVTLKPGREAAGNGRQRPDG